MANRVENWLQRKAHMLAALQHETARKTINGGGKREPDLQQVPKMDPAAHDAIRGRELTFVGWDEASIIESSYFHDAVIYGEAASRQQHWPTPKTPLGEYSDADLIMHMISRGYACMKMPKEGGLPEVLRDQD